MRPTFLDSRSRKIVRAEELRPTRTGEQPVHHRQSLLPWWDQKRLTEYVIFLIGEGGLGLKAAIEFVRMGVGHVKTCDGDVIVLHNLNRQPYLIGDVTKNKALAAADILKREATGNTTIEAYPMDFQDVLQDYPDALDGVGMAMVLVDNDKTRRFASEVFLRLKIPAIFSALSRDANYGYVFLQEPGHACFNCVFPRENDASGGKAPCADPSVIYTHQVMTGIIAYIAVQKIMGQKLPWHFMDLFLSGEARAFDPPRRADCEVCGG